MKESEEYFDLRSIDRAEYSLPGTAYRVCTGYIVCINIMATLKAG